MKPIIIAVAGGSASGKTTVVNKILASLPIADVTVIRHDDYYNDQSHMALEERYAVNYDHPSSLDNNLLVSDLHLLIEGRPISKPIYDFIQHTRSNQIEIIHPTRVIMLEGILILEDQRIRDLADIKIFVESDEDIRFIRRLLRDINERGRSLDSVVQQYLQTVKPMFYRYIKPTKRYADIIIPNDNKHDVAVDIIVSKAKSILEEKQ